ncbi:hypothetical protein BJI67_16410 (plasmid) [Acidihalobacter aeolianus]|uniref:Uncharacterized protein n=2 Tax=Acidihalobacter aeolianus TaxID=2792603 RepID=A0A1D8KCY5_9GAMM|nr:hypothetical protein BJI67_16410 [Acidihalobacter aeolianus]
MGELPQVPAERMIVRKGDMSPNTLLRLIRQDDGDMCVAIIDDEGNQTDVEFCVPGAGGGKSPNTWRGLYALAAAIEADNKEAPFRVAFR